MKNLVHTLGPGGFDQRFIDAREALRQTRTFGPLIDELSPPASKFTSGRMVIIKAIKSPGG